MLNKLHGILGLWKYNWKNKEHRTNSISSRQDKQDDPDAMITNLFDRIPFIRHCQTNKNPVLQVPLITAIGGDPLSITNFTEQKQDNQSGRLWSFSSVATGCKLFCGWLVYANFLFNTTVPIDDMLHMTLVDMQNISLYYYCVEVQNKRIVWRF